MHKSCFYGLKRSGNHAIIKWIWYNLFQSNMYRIKEINHISGGIFRDNISHNFFINNSKISIENTIISNIQSIYKIKHLFISYEDNFYTPSLFSYLIIRDFLNMLCSRIQQVKNFNKNPELLLQDANFYYSIINTWLNHSQFIENSNTILYNRWIASKDYRDNIAINLWSINNLDHIDYSQAFGGGSSFIGRNKENNIENYLHRYRQIDIPEFAKDIILHNGQLLTINQKYFNINIKSIVNESNSSNR